MEKWEVTIWPPRSNGVRDFGVYVALPDGNWRGIEDCCRESELPARIAHNLEHVRSGGGGIFSVIDGIRIP